MNLDSILLSARQAAAAGGDLLLQHFAKVAKVQKSESYNLVTAADVEAERVILNSLRADFPDHPILAEESAGEVPADPNEHEHLWIVDPLDGTNNFYHQIPHCAVSISYARWGVPHVGVVLNPFNGECFTAVRGQAAKKNGTPIQVNDNRLLSEILVGVGFYYDRDATMRQTLKCIQALFEEHIHGIRRLGTASLDLCYVACGRFGAYFEYELAPWDFAAGWLIVEEAGGRVTRGNGQPLAMSHQSVLATNGWVHDQIGRLTAEYHPNKLNHDAN